MPYLFLGFIAVMYINMDVIGSRWPDCAWRLCRGNMKFEEEEGFLDAGDKGNFPYNKEGFAAVCSGEALPCSPPGPLIK